MDRYNEVNAFTECEINSELQFSYTVLCFCMHILDTHISVGGVVIDVFESTVGAPINSSLRLADRK